MRYWDVDLDSHSLGELGRWCLERRGVNRLLVIGTESLRQRRTLDEPRVERAVAEIFANAVIDSEWARIWPGTRIAKHAASKVWFVRFDSVCLERMVQAEGDLREWHQYRDRPLPADLCLYREGDAVPAMASMTHDPGKGWREAWLFGADSAEAPFARSSDRLFPDELVPGPPRFIVAAKNV